MELTVPIIPAPSTRAVVFRLFPKDTVTVGLALSMQIARVSSLQLTIPISRAFMALSLPVASSPSTETITLTMPVSMIPASSLTFATDDGHQLIGATIKYDSTGNATATFRIDYKPTYGDRISIVQNDDIVIFSGRVTEVKKTAGEIGWRVVLSDDLKALTDAKVIVPKAEDVADAFKAILTEYDIPVYDNSERTFFPTHYTGDEVSISLLREIIEACRNSRLTLLPEGGYVLSNEPRRWVLESGKAFSYTDVVDVDHYANRIIVFVDEEYTQWVEELEDTTQTYGGFTVRKKNKGEQVHYIKASRGAEVLSEETSEWNENNYLSRHEAQKDGVNTTTEYTIETPEDRVAYVSLRHMLSVEV